MFTYIYDFHQVDPGQFAPSFSMEEDELDERLEKIRNRHARLEAVDRVQMDDFVTLDCHSLVPRYEKTNITLRVGRGLYHKKLEEARSQYVEDMAEAVAVEVSSEVNRLSEFVLDPDEIQEVILEGEQMAGEMLRSAGLDPETASDEDIMAVSGRSRKEHFDFIQEISVDGLKSTAIGAVLMERDGKTLTDEDYHHAVLECAEGMGLTEKEAEDVITYPKFLRQAAANYVFEQIIDYVTQYLQQQEVQS